MKRAKHKKKAENITAGSCFCKPDAEWGRAQAQKLVEWAGVQSEQVERVEILCANGGRGTVILKDGTRIPV